jgi:ribosomal protein L37AE/L43A
MTMSQEEKNAYCGRCRKWKSVSDFYKSKPWECKQCNHELRRARYLKTHEFKNKSKYRIGANEQVNALTYERLREVLNYDEKLDVWTWLKPSRKIRIGDVAGYTSSGRRKIGIDRKQYPVTRLAYLYKHGSFPNGHLQSLSNIK